jgi:hypothetical protein
MESPRCVTATSFFHFDELIHNCHRWLYAKKRDAEADESLCRLLDLPIDNELVQVQKQEILASIRLEELDAEDGLKIQNLFRDKSSTQVSKRIWLSWAIALGAPLYGGVCYFQKICNMRDEIIAN